MFSKQKVNKIISKGLYIVLVCVLFIPQACKKRTAFNEEDAREAIDSETFRAESDAVMEDINNTISNQFLLRGKGLSVSEQNQVEANQACGYTLDTTKISSGIITFVYNSQPCINRKREGRVVFSILDYPVKKWKQKGCVIKVDFLAFKVVGANDGQSMKVDGSIFITNESGSSWYDMRYLNVPTVIHSISGNDIKLSYEDGSVVVISVNRRYTYSISGGVINCTTDGLSTQNSRSNVESWGLSREGKQFTSEILSPLKWKTGCGSYMPFDGEIKVVVDGSYFELNCLYGVDQGGSSTDGSSCPYGWKASWKYKSKTNKRILSYTR